jgi:hypothetical protein
MPPNKTQDLAAKKAARQKKMLIVLAPVFIAVFVLMVLPKLTGGPGSGPPVAVGSVNATTPASTTPSASPTGTPSATPVVATAPVGPATSAALVAPAYSFSVNDGQLSRLDGKYQSKDPFAGAANHTITAPTLTAPFSPPSAKDLPQNTSTTPGSTGGPTPAKQAASPYIYAVVSVNGVAEGIALNGSFPAASPLFKLVELGKNYAKFTLLDGSFSNGISSVTLVKGHKVTVKNTADGSRYVIELVTTSQSVPTNPPTGTGTSQASGSNVLNVPGSGGGNGGSGATTTSGTDTSTPPPPTTPSS